MKIKTGGILLFVFFYQIGFGQAPQLTYPANGGAMPITDTLKWNAVAGASSYELTLGNDVNFTTFSTYSNIAATFLVPPFLFSDRTYFWRVRATISGSPGPWSTVFSFRIFTPGFIISPPILPEFDITDMASIQMADLTGTGNKEILFLGTRNPSGKKNAYRIRKENGNWVLIDSLYGSLLDIHRKYVPFPADLDNDGDLDIIGREELIWNENGQFAKSPFSSLIAPVVSENSVDRGNDGKNDVFFSLSGFAKNNGNRNFQFSAPNYFLSLGDGYADFNKDRRMDWARRDGFIGYHHPKKDTVDINVWLGQITNVNTQMFSPCIEDFDGNGWLDLAVLIYDGLTTTSLYVYYFNSTGRPFNTVSLSPNLGQVTILKAADLNNDGKPDLIYGDAPTNLMMVCRNVNGQLNLANATPLFGRSSSNTRMQPAVGDIDGDNDADIVIMDWAGKIRIMENVATQPNTKPNTPFMKRAKFDADTVIFTWNKATDAQQVSQTLQYNLRAGTTKYGNQIHSAGADSITGVRYSYSHANASQDTTWMVKGIKPGLYYYASQAIDASKVGSVFSNVDSVFVCAPVIALSPVNPLMAADTSLIFKWTSGKYATGYQVQLGFDSLYVNLARDTIVTDTTAFIRTLPNDTTLYWHVRSKNQDGTSAWTPSRLIDTRRIGIKLTWNYKYPLCSNSIISSNTSRGMGVLVYTKGLWNTGNQFILEISDYLGNFNAGRILTTITDSVAPDVIKFSLKGIPFATGFNYLLRVRSALPDLKSASSPPFGIRFNDYAGFFAVQPTPLCFDSTVTATYTDVNGSSDSSYWYKNFEFIKKVIAPGRSITLSQPGFYTAESYHSDLCICIDTILYKGIDCYKVWPGDANSDSRVNELDLFTIGKYFGKTGAARTDQGIDWRAYPATNWTETQNNYYNLKHADCNGDGTINALDTIAVSLNFNNTHILGRILEDPADSLRQTTQPVQVLLNQASYNPNETIKGTVIAGTSSQQLLFSGLAFELKLPDSLIVPGSFKIFTDSTGIFYQQGVNVYLNKDKKWVVHTANGKNIKGYGGVAKFSFVLRNVANNTPVSISASNIVFTNIKGGLWTSVSSKPGNATVNNIVTGINNPLPPGTFVTIAPNLITGKDVRIISKINTPVRGRILLYNSSGQLLKSRAIIWLAGTNTTIMEIPTVAKEMYYIRIETNKWAITRKAIVQ
jgi:hypothetical protein